MYDRSKPRVRRTPGCRHLYTASLYGYSTYGWGDTPDEARSKLAENIERSGEKQQRGTYSREPPQWGADDQG